jgi:Enolase C-terminal domain-like
VDQVPHARRPEAVRSAITVEARRLPPGLAESLKVAAMADAYEVNVAPHNFYSHLATLMSMHLCAVAPNVRIMEIDVGQAPWVDDLVTVKPDIRDGYVYLPTGPGWGTEVNGKPSSPTRQSSPRGASCGRGFYVVRVGGGRGFT